MTAQICVQISVVSGVVPLENMVVSISFITVLAIVMLDLTWSFELGSIRN